MSTPFTCDDKVRLVAYLYGEAEPADRAAVEGHLRSCAACASELVGFEAVRQDLRAWEPPDGALGFRIVRDSDARRAWWRMPVWVPAGAAGVLALAAAAAVVQLEVRYDEQGFAVRTGWQRVAALSAPAMADAEVATPRVASDREPPTGVSEAELREAMASLEQRLRLQLRPTPQTPVRVQAAPPDRNAVFQRVHALIEESERRQQRELALRLTQLVQDFERQRRLDLVRIEQGLGQLEGATGEEAARQRRLLNYLVRASQQR